MSHEIINENTPKAILTYSLKPEAGSEADVLGFGTNTVLMDVSGVNRSQRKLLAVNYIIGYKKQITPKLINLFVDKTAGLNKDEILELLYKLKNLPRKTENAFENELASYLLELWDNKF